MSNYDVLVQPDDRYWYVQVPAIERSTQAKGLENATAQAAAESRLAAQALRNEGLTYRQIGALLGVSYQRAFQLVNGKTKHKTTASESPQPTTESRSPRTNHATPLSTPVSA